MYVLSDLYPKGVETRVPPPCGKLNHQPIYPSCPGAYYK